MAEEQVHEGSKQKSKKFFKSVQLNLQKHKREAAHGEPKMKLGYNS